MKCPWKTSSKTKRKPTEKVIPDLRSTEIGREIGESERGASEMREDPAPTEDIIWYFI